MPVLRPSVGDILKAMESKLLVNGVIKDATQFIVTMRGDPPHLVAKFDVVVKVSRYFSIKPRSEGGSRWDTVITRTIFVQARTLFAGSGAGNDKDWAYAHYPREDALLDALHEFHPEDEDGNVLLVVPMTLSSGEAAEREMPSASGGAAWADSVFGLDVTYYPNITPGDEA